MKRETVGGGVSGVGSLTHDKNKLETPINIIKQDENGPNSTFTQI